MLFKYKIKKADGTIETGQKDVQDKFVLYKEIHAAGGEIISLNEGHAGGTGLKMNISIPGFGGIKIHEKIIFAKNLSSMLDAGLSLARSLTVISKQSKNKKFVAIINTILEDISKGKTLADALAAHNKVFPGLFISMVRAGEQSGSLSDSLKSVGIQMDRMYTLQRKVKGAMVYPTVIFIVMIAIAILMLVFIVPTLTSTFTEMNVSLPASTKMIMATSDFMRHHYILFIVVIVILISGIYSGMKTKKGKRLWDLTVLKIPMIGGMVKEVNAARTGRTLASLLSAGVDVVGSLKITEEVLQNSYYKEIVAKGQEMVQKGEPMSKVFLDNEKFYPVFVGEMMSVGEETGKVADMLKGVAQYYEDEVEQKTKDMSSVIEPFLMVIIGIAVGFFAISMIMPMYSLADKI